MPRELSREEEFREWAALEATRLERFARELREGKWETYDLHGSIEKKNVGPGQERILIVMRASRLQALGTGLAVDEPSEPEPA
jgi:hypothetical protein